ncbi:GGDEF domain-containing protein [Sphingomonas sp. PB4P5]|uniref:GGDEF domain-containing protein n=1 Tax=Parasphingomonas puruogangriensis TaxID=3096155 RepID=UPI002FC7F4D8
MRFYEATRFLFPRSYQLRIFAVCFGATHLPLIAFCAAQLMFQRWDWPLFGALLMATLIGTAAAIWALSALLAPIAHATTLLTRLQRGERVVPVTTGGKDLVGALLAGVARASAETAARIELLADAAEKDLLTGLRNRRGFMDAITPLLRDDRTSVIAMLDLDHFKSINDRFGHDEGDRVLSAFALRLEAGLRMSDLAARWGGEEFAILLPDTDLDEATEIVDRLRLSLHADNITRAGSEPLTFSCGLAAVRDYRSLSAAMRKADTALYEAKHSGRDRVRSLA